MSADVRPVATDALATLGNVITEGARDAIHLAVEPVIAGCLLHPGEHVGIVNGVATRRAEKKLGIVDPFIVGRVMKGQKFWLIVYPRQISSLRHVWEHPDFQQNVQGVPSEATLMSSESWLRDFCENNDAPNLDSLLNKIADGDYEIDGEYFYVGDADGHCNIPTTFWHHLEIVSGKSFPVRAQHFSCSC